LAGGTIDAAWSVMPRIFTLAMLSLALMGGTALADRGRSQVSKRGSVTYSQRADRTVRDHRRPTVARRDVHASNGRFTFHNGVTRHHARTVIRHRYFDYRVRPQIIVHSYDPVPGYTWIQGSWSWNGYEWIWTDGYWAVDSSYYY
jgi:hypothetical protein